MIGFLAIDARWCSTYNNYSQHLSNHILKFLQQDKLLQQKLTAKKIISNNNICFLSKNIKFCSFCTISEFWLSQCFIHFFILMLPLASGTFRVPENLMLDCRGITSAGLKVDINKMCADVIELDLAQNDIKSWQEVRCYWCICVVHTYTYMKVLKWLRNY